MINNLDLKNIEYTYDYQNENFERLRNIYINEILIEDNDFNTIRNAMVWVFDNLYYEEKEEFDVKYFNSLIILEYNSTGKYRFNCWHMALTLTEILLSMGVKVKMIRCMKEPLIIEECHCVVHAYSNYYRKWILFDVANKSIYYDKSGVPMDLNEFRNAALNNKRIFIPKCSSDFKIKLIKYWLPNLVRFQCYLKSQFNNEIFDGERIIINLLPKYLNYDNSISYYNGNKIYDIYIKDNDQFWK